MKHIAVDFDGTLRRPLNKGQNIFHKILLSYLKKKQKQGVIIILNTLRTDDRLADALKWLYCKGFTPDFVNENDPKCHDIMKYSDPRKIDADMYIDDRNPGLIGWLLRTF